MEAIENFFTKLNENKKIQIYFFIVSMCFLFIIYSISIYYVQIKTVQKIEVSTDNSFLAHVKQVEQKDNKLKIDGWIFRIDSKIKNAFLMLRDVNGTDVEIFPLDIYSNQSITSYFQLVIKNDLCGFTTNINLNNIKENTCYEILAVLDYMQIVNEKSNKRYYKKISLQQYLYNGELLQYNPFEYVKPVLNDMEFNNAIINGTLLSYDIKNSCWIYEYQSNLYCIFNTKLFETLNSSPEIPVFIYTTKNENLPENRRERGNDYIAYYLNSEDIKSIENKEYFLYVVALPKEYPITKIQLGVYLNGGLEPGWKWKTTITNFWFN